MTLGKLGSGMGSLGLPGKPSASQPLNRTQLANNATVSVADFTWLTQQPNRVLDANGAEQTSPIRGGIWSDNVTAGLYYFEVYSGEYTSLTGDPPRKMRAELGGYDTFSFAQNATFRVLYDVYIDPSTNVAGVDFDSFDQNHQADSRFSDGVPVTSSPMFTAEFLQGSGSQIDLRVRGETSTGLPASGSFPPVRILGTLTNIPLGTWLSAEKIINDGHGFDGRIYYNFNGTTVVNFAGPTGFQYVDIQQHVAYPGHPGDQPTESYQKLGVYSGMNSGALPPPTAARVKLRYRNIRIKVLQTVLPDGKVGVAYSFTPTMTRTSGGGTITWSASGLPTSLSINSSTGAITGTPTVNATFTPTITATDNDGATTSLPITVFISPAVASGGLDFTNPSNSSLIAAIAA